MKLILYCIFLVVVYSCSDSNTEILQELYGKEIFEPIQALHKIATKNRSLKDTLIDAFGNKNKFKILSYYNTSECTSCRLKELAKWKNIMSEVKNTQDSLINMNNIEFVFIFNVGEQLHELELNLRLHKLNIPVMFDMKGEFEKINSLPSPEMFHCFLLDKNNKILIVGSPVKNEKIWLLYKKKILEI